MYLIQTLDAGHTPNGNPKRVYVVYNSDGEVTRVFDEGYEGVHAVPETILSQGYVILPTVKVPHSEYKFWLKRGKAMQERV